MKDIRRQISALIIMLLLLYAVGIYIQFAHQNETLINETKDRAYLSANLLARDVISHLRTNGQVVFSIGDYLEVNHHDEDQIQLVLKKSIAENPFFRDIYYMDNNNRIINGSGITLAADFDAWKREVYEKAQRGNKRIIEGEYKIALDNQNVITIAEPVLDENNDIIGVIAGDIKPDGIQAIINNIYHSASAFIVDEHGIIIYQDNTMKAHKERIREIEDLGMNSEEVLENGNDEPHKVTFDGQEGFVTFKAIENTDWKVGSITLYKDSLRGRIFALVLLFVTSVFGIIFLGVLMNIGEKKILYPLVMLEESLKQIDVAENTNYRVPQDTKSPFRFLNKSINYILDKNQEYLNRLKAEERNLRNSFERNKVIINAIPDTLFIVNKEGKFIEILKNNKKEAFFEDDRILGKSIFDLFSRDFAENAFEKIGLAIETNEPQICEHESRINDERCLFECRLIKSSEDEVLIISRDITKQKNLEKELEYLSYRDALTGAYNRRFFEGELKKVDKRENLPISVVMADVDGLKNLNDSLGHDAGDELLIKASNAMSEVVKGRFKISRIGGDEFVIIMPRTSKPEAEEIVKKIAKRVEKEKIYSRNISISFGCETKIKLSHKLIETVSKAEKKMYIEKEAKRR